MERKVSIRPEVSDIIRTDENAMIRSFTVHYINDSNNKQDGIITAVKTDQVLVEALCQT
jgi:hypothetical protein